MKKWNLLDEKSTPDGRVMKLFEKDGVFTIRINGTDLMSTRQHHSEEELAEAACAGLKNKVSARILIGGLGFGFTLRKALSCLSTGASVVVAEIMAAVVRWNQNQDYPLAADALADPRVQVVGLDVAKVIRDDKEKFDAIILDVDNGPVALSTDTNKQLYRRAGLVKARQALRAGGCLAVWSASEDIAFAKLMQTVGFEVEVRRSRAHGDRGAWHSIFLGRL